MKRTFKSKPKFPFKMRSSGIHGEFRPKSPLSASTTSCDEGTKKVKRALFPMPGSNNLHNLKLDAASIQSEAAKAKRAADAPKTSEYAYFKKMKESVRNNSYLLHNAANQLKNVELRDCSRESPCKRSRSNYVRSSPLPVERTHPETCYSIKSPPCDGSKNPEVNDVFVLGCMNPEKVKPVDHQSSPPPADSKLKYPGSKKVLPANRKKLQQWVGNTLLHEVDELCSNSHSDSMPWKTGTSTSFSESDTIDEGHPIEAISWTEPDHRSYMDNYISRWPMENGRCSDPMPWRIEIYTKDELPLFPELRTPIRSRQARRRKLIETEPQSYMGDYFSSLPLENRCCSDSMSWKVETDTKYELAPFREPNIPIAGHQTQRRKFVEPEHWSYLDDYSPRRIIMNSGHADPMFWQVELCNKEELPPFNNSDALLNRQQIHGTGSNESERSFMNGLFSRWSCGHRDTDLLEWDTIGPDSSYFSYNAKVHNHVRFSESCGFTDGRRIPSLVSENRSFDEYLQTHPSGHLKGAYIWHVDDEPRLIGGSHPLLLEWGCKDEEDETHMPALDSHVEMNTVMTSPNRHIRSPPSFSNKYSDITLLAHYSLAEGHHSTNDAPRVLQNKCQHSFLLRKDDDENLQYCLTGRNHLSGPRMNYQSWSLNDFETYHDQGIDQMGSHLLLPTSTVDNYEEGPYLDKYSSDEC